MPIAPGARLGPYEVVSGIGAGGMGEVYRARDTRLDRAVAIKVLPASLSSDPDRRSRFEREAKAISALNHPHICTLHDVGRQDGIDYLVMELVEGESLADRLRRGPLPLDQILRYGQETAEALNVAHRLGIVHRDLKPANVMLTKAGVKLLDFGLAKLYGEGGSGPGTLSALATAEKPLTGEGTLVGTVPYMSPEQLEGKPADARSDVWAVGTLLYEMTTGQRAFTGKGQAGLIAAILEKEPVPLTTLQPMSPPALERLVRTCLAKDPDERWQSVHDLAAELRWIAEGGSLAGVAAPTAMRRRGRERLAWTATTLLLASTVGLAIGYVQRAPPPLQVTRFQMSPPEGESFAVEDGPVAVSPDGRRIIYGLPGSLVVRELASLSARPIPGSEGSYDPFWSPDGRSLAFFDKHLIRAEASSGARQPLAEVVDARGGTWSRDDVILFAPDPRGGLYRVSAAGGPVQPATQLDASRQETAHIRPHFLPDGKHFLFVVESPLPENAGIHLGQLDSPLKKRLLPVLGVPQYASGYLLYVSNRSLFAHRFDLKRLEIAGGSVPVVERVDFSERWSGTAFSVSPAGVLAYHEPGTPVSQPSWFDRGGKLLGRIGEPGDENMDLSADGKRLAVQNLDPATRMGDIWVIDLVRGVRSRVSFEQTHDIGPVWSPDGKWLASASYGADGWRLLRRPSDGSGVVEELHRELHGLEAVEYSPDGRHLVYEASTAGGRTDLFALPLSGESRPVPVAVTAFEEHSGRLSPSGRFIAYASQESGENEIYVQPFPPTGAKWQVSSGGGNAPRWRHDGRELYYKAGLALVAVAVRDGPAFEAAAPRTLFEVDSQDYEPAADGQRFLVSAPIRERTGAPITVVLNWPEELKSR